MSKADGSKLVVFGGPEVIYSPGYTFTCNKTTLHAVEITSAGSVTDGTALLAQTTTGVHTRAMVVADFNGDSHDDLFVANHGCDDPSKNMQNETNNLFLSSGHQITDASSEVSGLPPAFTHSVAAAATGYSQDVDVLVGVMGGDGPYILRGDGAGHFTKDTSSLASLGEYASAKFVDVNGDSMADLVVGYDQSGATAGAVLLNDGKGYFKGPAIPLPVGVMGANNTIIVGIESTDVNGDGKADLILSSSQNAPTYYGNGRLQVLIGDGDGTFTDKTSAYLPVNNNRAWTQAVHVVDLDSDGKLDLLLQTENPQVNDVIAYKNNGTNFTPIARSDLPPSVITLIPVKNNSTLSLVSLVPNGLAVTATMYQLK
ncbi:VCBS repeat-containing protein [Massilia sp.]|uniref:FG-GAP repeat domain-containing protein n=1 Tax=Massilia sp. TaxID=1882437 RepID=UPI0028964DEF|nr:VCBS repeat-containing protein [Massilia sp.]